MTSSNAALVDIDRAHLIHPVAPWRKHEARGVTILESGNGVWLKDAAGNTLLDAFAGLWCVNVGYGQESVVRANTAQWDFVDCSKIATWSFELRHFHPLRFISACKPSSTTGAT